VEIGENNNDQADTPDIAVAVFLRSHPKPHSTKRSLLSLAPDLTLLSLLMHPQRLRDASRILSLIGRQVETITAAILQR